MTADRPEADGRTPISVSLLEPAILELGKFRAEGFPILLFFQMLQLALFFFRNARLTVGR